jgi:pyrroloquinoline quinone biosynthesis protein E
MIALAEKLQADRLELANTQYLGWALVNRPALLPTSRAALQCTGACRRSKEEARRTNGILFVTPDYFAEYPKTCMDGWGQRFIVVSPDGLRPALPCGAHHSRPELR